MKVLYVDTTTVDLVVAVIEEDRISDFSQRNLGTRHSETLCGCIDTALKGCGLSFADLDAYACAVGPGSFTGIRIGISTLKGYCMAVEKPLIAVNCLEAIAVSPACGCLGRAILDAGNGYYFADYSSTRRIEPCLVQYDDKRSKGCALVKSATEYFDGAIEVVRRKFAERVFVDEFEPCYIRRSQAEER
ncbi:MAG: tRNA (adenosine(37)-N6)-threonylcarbamoyltransferase complex dimerization subunit type 1 TsaB [Corallococcus sp.]|nr:tRNA (adenosine(37)-N6)-threonylcarbamoyltransferase complex dimerization subunit type 1 TsaB [Corallococcus sp.]MCM1359228.1 tRNA (adenosine(37)-N6)-threonylcarbamoyltransferase complex dimerization subunit type 1 TsaB [Corallococcus sp.]MCM1394619.1 tRNA (adenosine(37)-N6)-threonylcarbamoyltransferase complex dimerization subunit type 1 TsaB [Corallococcus sp.]